MLLRPVVESAVLPTVAYVAGPGELRYLALTPPVYDGLDVDRQLPVARWSGLAVEPRVERVMTKFNLTVEDLLGPDGVIERRIARSQLPESVTSTVSRLRQALEDEYGSLTPRRWVSTQRWRRRCRVRAATQSAAWRRSRRSW